MTDTPPDNDETKDSASPLEKGFARARPVLFGEKHYFLKVNPESGDLWIVHDVPVDLDLKDAEFDAHEGLLNFVTISGEEFEMGIVIRNDLRSKIAKAKRVTLIYIPGETIENMIFIPLRQKA